MMRSTLSYKSYEKAKVFVLSHTSSTYSETTNAYFAPIPLSLKACLLPFPLTAARLNGIRAPPTRLPKLKPEQQY